MLEITAFFCGALVMILEMAGVRVLAPHVGTSVIVWTSLIGVVLACLALGAWAGGRFADKKLSRKGLAQILLCSALGSAIPAFFHNAIGSGITSAVSNLYAAAVLAAICIFALPAFFFGMVTPYVIRLRIAKVDTAGATVGRLYALSTAGSILGTFLGGFFLISFLSSSTILWSVACSVLLLSLLNYRTSPVFRLGLLGLMIFFAFQDKAYADWLVARGGAMLIESPYNSIQISEGTDSMHNNARVRLMSTNPGYLQSGMYIDDPTELYFDYTRYYALGPRYVPQAKSVLMLGGGGYSVPKWLLSSKSGMPKDISVDVVELDPVMTALAAKIFGLPSDPRLSIYHEDARAWLNSQSKQYDLVFVDVFNSHYAIPFQMTTREAIAAMRRAVAPGGALLMNVISAIAGEDGRFFRALLRGIREDFPDVYVYCVGQPQHPENVQNLMIVALPETKRCQTPLVKRSGLSPTPEEMEKMSQRLYKQPIAEDMPVLTDDFAPVERYALMLTRK